MQGLFAHENDEMDPHEQDTWKDQEVNSNTNTLFQAPIKLSSTRKVLEITFLSLLEEQRALRQPPKKLLQPVDKDNVLSIFDNSIKAVEHFSALRTDISLPTN